MRPGGWVAVPRHVGRNYVPLLCGVDTDLRYYVIRDRYLNTVVPLDYIRVCITVTPPLSHSPPSLPSHPPFPPSPSSIPLPPSLSQPPSIPSPSSLPPLPPSLIFPSLPSLPL